MLSGPKDTEHNQEMGQRSDEEAEDVDGEHVQVRIAIKTRECGDASSAQASLVSSAGFTEVVDVKVLPRPSLPPNFTRRPSSLKLLPLSTALNEENSGSKTRFLSTEELRQRSEAAAAVSTELKGDGSANDFRREVVAVRTEAGCAWRTLPSTGESAHRGRSVSSSSSSGRVSNGSTDDGVLVSVSTGHRSLWRPASLSTELAACHEAASNAVKQLTALPPSAYEVTPDEKTSKANNDNSPCFLLVASECIQRLTVQANVSESTEIAASPSVVKASRRGNFLGASLGEKRRCDSADDKVKQESSSNEIKEELDTRNDEQVNNGDDNDYADGMDNEATKLVAQAAIVRVHRTIPLSDLQRAWTGGGDRTISSDDGKGGMDSSRKKQASDELRVGIECVVPARSRHASSHSARAFGWRKSGASARTGLMAAFRTSAHGNSGNGASCKDGDANSNSRHGSSSNNSKNSRFPMRNAPLMRKRTFYFITSNANEVIPDCANEYFRMLCFDLLERVLKVNYTCNVLDFLHHRSFFVHMTTSSMLTFLRLRVITLWTCYSARSRFERTARHVQTFAELRQPSAHCHSSSEPSRHDSAPLFTFIPRSRRSEESEKQGKWGIARRQWRWTYVHRYVGLGGGESKRSQRKVCFRSHLSIRPHR